MLPVKKQVQQVYFVGHAVLLCQKWKHNSRLFQPLVLFIVATFFGFLGHENLALSTSSRRKAKSHTKQCGLSRSSCCFPKKKKKGKSVNIILKSVQRCMAQFLAVWFCMSLWAALSLRAGNTKQGTVVYVSKIHDVLLDCQLLQTDRNTSPTTKHLQTYYYMCLSVRLESSFLNWWIKKNKCLSKWLLCATLHCACSNCMLT